MTHLLNTKCHSQNLLVLKNDSHLCAILHVPTSESEDNNILLLCYCVALCVFTLLHTLENIQFFYRITNFAMSYDGIIINTAYWDSYAGAI